MLKQVTLDMQNQLLQVKTSRIAIADEHLLRKKHKRTSTSMPMCGKRRSPRQKAGDLPLPQSIAPSVSQHAEATIRNRASKAQSRTESARINSKGN